MAYLLADQVVAPSAVQPPPGGSNQQIQYNNAGAFGGITNSAYDGTSLTLGFPITVSGSTKVGSVSTTATGTALVDFSVADSWRFRLTGNTTVSFTNPPPSGKYQEVRVKVMQNNTTSYTLAFPSITKWSYGISPTTQPSTSTINTFVFATEDGGATFDGYWTGAFMQ